MTGPASGEAAPGDWKRYPLTLAEDDPELVFPAAEGDQGAESNTFYVAGRLRGRTTGRTWAFLTIFAQNDVRRRVRADFHTVALFDLGDGSYGTSTDYDFPRLLRRRTRHRLSVARGHLDVTYRGDAGNSSLRSRRDASGDLVPFAYDLHVVGRDAEGRAMGLELELDAMKRPALVGGEQYRGVKTWMGQVGTHSYFLSDVRFRGALSWGETSEPVDGDCGWIDRQWAPRYFGVHGGARGRLYRHEWREIHLDNGIDMSVWTQVDRRRCNRPIPFGGATAAGPKGQVGATTDVVIEHLSFVRDPGEVAPRHSLPGPRYFGDVYRITIPFWELDLVSEPLVAAPAHALPIECWSGPTSLRGTLGGAAVTGFGFHERTVVYSRDFELVDVLRNTARHLPAEATGASLSAPSLANVVWEIDTFLSHRDHQSAVRYLNAEVRPEIERLADPWRARLQRIADDTEDALMRWWVRP
jgi:hypothetical protein